MREWCVGCVGREFIGRGKLENEVVSVGDGWLDVPEMEFYDSATNWKVLKSAENM